MKPKREKEPNPRKCVPDCQTNLRGWQRALFKQIDAHTQAKVILTAEIRQLETDLADTTWLLSNIKSRVESQGESASLILTPAEKTQIAQWKAERIIRFDKNARGNNA